MRRNPIYVEIDIAAELEELWRHTQTPELHQQWDVRFTNITYLEKDDQEALQKFLYRTHIGFGIQVSGTGESISNLRLDQNRAISTLAFASSQKRSLIHKGGGYWKYQSSKKGVTFSTQFDYQTRFGRVGKWFDTLVFRPLFGAATAWSFDVLRLWLEQKIPPRVSVERTLIHWISVSLLFLLWMIQGIVPKLLFPEAGELEVLRHTGLFPGWEQPLLVVLGLIEMTIAWLTIKYHTNRLLYLIQICILTALAAGAIIGQPDILQAPFNPLTLSVGMIGFCWLACISRIHLPSARHCQRQPDQPLKKR